MNQRAQYAGVDPVTGMGRILHIADGLIESEQTCERKDLPLLSPGLVDLQVNGYSGYDLNSGELEADEVEALSNALCSVGVAKYLPTLITASEQNLCQRLSAIREAQLKLPRSKRMIAGIHVEGPSISSEDGPRGAHPAEHIRPLSIIEFEHWQQAAGGLIRMITLAPELTGSTEYIRDLSERGVCVALGHSAASEQDITRAVDAGAQVSTHLGNGIANMMPRHPNAIWTQLAEDRLSASLILDGHHLPRSTARSMIRAKGIDRICLISDSVTFAGMATGRYSSPIGGDVDVSADGRVSVADTPYLAGSGTCLLSIVENFAAFVGLPFHDGLNMATRNPARLLGLSITLAPGEPADFILFDSDNQTGKAKVRDIIFDGVSVLQ